VGAQAREDHPGDPTSRVCPHPGPPPQAGEGVAASVTHAELFLGFLRVALRGFGGVLPWVRRALVEERRWLTEQEFTEVLGLGQFLPGPNVVNVSICIGARFHGLTGAIVAYLGLMLAPALLVLSLGILYGEFGNLALVHGAFRGIAAAAAGLVVAMGVKIAMQLRKLRWAIGVAAIGFVGVGVLRLPLPIVLLSLAPVSVAIAWWRRR
jgi:chromate transporter